ncbi:hypothetical protein FB45DRAFT_1008281 [Roridomyces roridus]|uniref:BRCT domain-containing protein n=1 Tax=Roridomyces roridus TaxID=1738132 RepID=A0AAD7FEB5_9AGAR|nr:hypothetical protein FB45DRAFT_1008281 [Roridomyces roridus]
MATSSEPIFHGVLYHLILHGGSTTSTALALRRLLDEHGGTEVDSPRKATRVIMEASQYEKPETVAALKHWRMSGVVVTPEWVYSSIEAGVKRPSQYYSADPKLFFSSVVVSPGDLSSPPVLQRTVTILGGQWLGAPTAQTTHCISTSASHHTDTDSVTMSPQSFLEFVARKERLPQPSHCVVGGRKVSRAHFFCFALLAQKVGSDVQTKAPVVSVSESRPLPYLPYEVVAEIFLVFKRESLATPGPSFVRSLLKLTHVCGRWRLIAHYTAELWTDLHLDFHSKRPYRRLENIVTQWVERSSPRALSVYVRSIYSRAHNPVIDFIVANSSRIRALRLELPEGHFLPLLRQPSGTFPSLEKLTLVVIPSSATDYDPYEGVSRAEYFDPEFVHAHDDDAGPQIMWKDVRTPVSVFHNTPLMRSFFIKSAGMFIFNPSLLRLISWNTLTDVDFGHVALGILDAASLLPTFTSARRLVLRMDSRQGSFMPLIGRTTLPIEEFHWCGYGVIDDASVIAPLVLPRLKYLDIRDVVEDTLLSLHSRSAFKLETLKLTFCYLTFAGFSALLRDMSSLTVLELSKSITITDDLLEFLVLVHDPATIRGVLPRLERLQLITGHAHFSEHLMMRMITSRWIHTPLVKVRLSKSNRVVDTPVGQAEHRAVLDWVVGLVEAGLEFEYSLTEICPIFG